MESSLLDLALKLSRALKGKLSECPAVGTQFSLKRSLKTIKVKDKLIHLKSRDQRQSKYCIVTERSEPSEKRCHTWGLHIPTWTLQKAMVGWSSTQILRPGKMFRRASSHWNPSQKVLPEKFTNFHLLNVKLCIDWEQEIHIWMFFLFPELKGRIVK